MSRKNQQRVKFDNLLMDWARGELASHEAAEFEGLLREYPDWRAEAEDFRNLRNLVRQAAEPTAPEGLLASALRRARSDEVVPDPFKNEDEAGVAAPVMVVPIEETPPARERRRAAPWGLAAAAALAVVAGGSALLLMRSDDSAVLPETVSTRDIAMVTVADQAVEEDAAMAAPPARPAYETARSLASQAVPVTEDSDALIEAYAAAVSEIAEALDISEAEDERAIAMGFAGSAIADPEELEPPAFLYSEHLAAGLAEPQPSTTVSRGDVWRIRNGDDDDQDDAPPMRAMAGATIPVEAAEPTELAAAVAPPGGLPPEEGKAVEEPEQPRLAPIPPADYTVLMAQAMASGARIIPAPGVPGAEMSTMMAPGGLPSPGPGAASFQAEFPDDDAVEFFLDRLASVSAEATTIAPRTMSAAPATATPRARTESRTTTLAPAERETMTRSLAPGALTADRVRREADDAPPAPAREPSYRRSVTEATAGFDLARYDYKVREDPDTGRRILTMTLRASED